MADGPVLDLAGHILRSKAAGDVVRLLIFVIAIGVAGIGSGGYYFGSQIVAKLDRIEGIDDRLMKIEVARAAGVQNNDRRVSGLEMMLERHQQQLGRIEVRLENHEGRLGR